MFSCMISQGGQKSLDNFVKGKFKLQMSINLQNVQKLLYDAGAIDQPDQVKSQVEND